MPRPGQIKQAQVVGIQSEEQQQLLDRVGRFSKGAVAVIGRALAAKKPCGSCFNGAPRKLGVDGKCAVCKGEALVYDFEQNRWAAEQILGRKIPMPKAIEMKVEDKSDKEELVKAFQHMKKPQVDSLLKEFNERIENLSRMDQKMIAMEELDEPADGATAA